MWAPTFENMKSALDVRKMAYLSALTWRFASWHRAILFSSLSTYISSFSSAGPPLGGTVAERERRSSTRKLSSSSLPVFLLPCPLRASEMTGARKTTWPSLLVCNTSCLAKLSNNSVPDQAGFNVQLLHDHVHTLPAGNSYGVPVYPGYGDHPQPPPNTNSPSLLVGLWPLHHCSALPGSLYHPLPAVESGLSLSHSHPSPSTDCHTSLLSHQGPHGHHHGGGGVSIMVTPSNTSF